MTITTKEMKRLAQLINAFGNASLKDGEIEVDCEKKPYINLISALYKIQEIKEVYDEDITIYGINEEILKRHRVLPVCIKEEDVEAIIRNVVKTLKESIADHLIVIPIQYAQFDKVIKFDQLIFIPQSFKRRDKLRIISRAAGKTIDETNWIANHTETSRSPDFFKYPILCIKQIQQTSTVHYNSLNLSKIIIYALRCFYFGRIQKTSKDKTTPFISLESSSHEISSHLAIYSKENWRQNHKPLNFDASLPFDLSWLDDKTISKEFRSFIQQIYFRNIFDDFHICFLNSLILFNESINQNASISTIILMTIGESILTRNTNEKRLRISAITPRLIKLPKNQKKKIAKILSDLYHKRNNFVHSGEQVTMNYDFETEEPPILETGRHIIAKLILEFPKFEKNIEKKIQRADISESPKTRMSIWEKYIDSIFQEIIYGK